MRRRLIFAPVGLQPAAVLSPLLSPPVRPDPEDAAVLVASPESAEFAERIRKRLVRFVGDRPSIEVITVEAGPLSAPRVGRLRDRAEDALRGEGEVGLLVNGGDGVWLHQLLEVLLAVDTMLAPRIWLASSLASGTSGTLFFLDGRVEAFDVIDIPRDELLELLGLRWRNGGLERPHPTLLRIEGIADRELRASRGSLYACVDFSAASGSTQSKRDAAKDALRRYRALLRYGVLQDLGLEQRRILLRFDDAETGGGLVSRARRDGFAVCDRRGRGAFDAFFRDRSRPMPSRRSSGATATDSRTALPDATHGNRDPRSRPLVIILGPNPGPTVQAIASHGSDYVVLLCDESNRLVREHARRLAEVREEVFPETTIQFVPMGGFSARLDALRAVLSANVFQQPLDIELRPGEKLRRLFLHYWAARAGGHRLWLLDRTVVSTLDGGRRRGARVPLSTWLDVHRAAAVRVEEEAWWDEDTRPPDQLTEMARDVAAYLRRTKDLGWLHRLGKSGRKGGLRVVDNQLLVPREGGEDRCYDLAELQALAGCKTFSGAFPAGESDESGRWFEWVVGVALFDAGVEEVQIGTVGIEKGRETDELDVLSAHHGSYVYWSCKTSGTRSVINQATPEARAVAERYLGRGAGAVVVVPRVLRPASTWQRIADGHWRLADRVDVADMRLFTDPGRVLDLALRGTGPSR